MKRLLLTTALLAAVGATPAYALLQLSIDVNGTVFSCADGQLSCDVSGGANNVLTIDQTINGVFTQITLTDSSSGELSLSAANITDTDGIAHSITFIASNTSFGVPVNQIEESGSLTSQTNIGGGFTASFYADPLNGQGANPTNTPGTNLFTTSGSITTDPQAFQGNNLSAFVANSPFSMTEGVNISLNAGGVITGFDENMQSINAIPEPSTWVMMGGGFGLLGLLGLRKRNRTPRFAV